LWIGGGDETKYPGSDGTMIWNFGCVDADKIFTASKNSIKEPMAGQLIDGEEGKKWSEPGHPCRSTTGTAFSSSEKMPIK
jgi:hypothetical protein